jgi:hypothetical protein
MHPKLEPAAWIGFLGAALGLLTSLNLHGFSTAQVSLIVAAISAIAGVVMAVATRPIMPGVFTGAVSALAALAAGYGFHVSPGVVGAVNALVLAGLALLTRAQVSPVSAVRS